jgi:hypothetical protein
MIAQVLNRQFVLDQLEAVRQQLEEDSAGGRRGGVAAPDIADLALDDFALALDEVRAAAAREQVESSGQPGFPPPPAERRGEQAPPLDDFAFISRDPVISLLQSALEAYFDEHASEGERVANEEPADDGRRGAQEDVAVTDRSIEGLAPTRDAEGRRLFDQFSVTDVRWVSSLVAMGIRSFRKRHPFNTNPANPITIADRSRLLLVGDWGSGLPRARKVADQMRRVMEQGGNIEQHVIHLGDVYYSGWKREYEKRFLPYWPVQSGEEARYGSWCLNGNHDMYAGGHDYFKYLLADPRFARHERCSYFALRTGHWQILGLDTAWKDEDLEDPQAEWVSATVSGDGRKVMLLSHHQLFSAYETAKSGAPLTNKLKAVLDAGRVRAWFWGHEHRCMLYHRHANVEFGRCVGHGGVPVYMSHEENDPYPPPGAYEYRAAIDKGLERWAKFGFVVLDFDGPAIDVRYIDEEGVEHHRERLE